MGTPTDRLERRLHRDFGPDAQHVIAALRDVPESLRMVPAPDGERLQAALVLAAEGSVPQFEALLRLAAADWRDVLLAADLGAADWRLRLDSELGAGAWSG